MQLRCRPAFTIAIGALLTVGAFVIGHFLYEGGNQRIGYTLGMVAMAPLAVSALQVRRVTGKTWPNVLFWAVVGLWAAMVLFSFM